MPAQDWIQRLKLAPLPLEGGWHRRIYTHLEGDGSRATASAIFFVLEPGQFSAMHRLLEGEEVFYHLAGDAAEMFQLDPQTGEGHWQRLGPISDAEASPVAIVRKGVWQGTRLVEGAREGTLFGVQVTPEFTWEQFEIATPALLEAFPGYANEFRQLLPTQRGTSTNLP